jgi:histidyl-tRNA synthetase
MKIRSVRGTNDLLPSSIGIWQEIESKVHELFRIYGFAELRTPILEETDLFVRSIGNETDIVQKEMYTFESGKGKSVSMRPEGTASVVRAYIEHGLHQSNVVSRFYYLGPMFRRERPQKGRFRQFHQVGAEVLGSDHPAIESESIEMLTRLFQEVGVDGLSLLINSVGCSECRPGYVRLLQNELAEIQDEELCPECRQRSLQNPLRVLDCKVPSCQPVIESLPSILDHLCKACQNHFSRFQNYLDLQGTVYQVSPRLVRGLDYYVRTTFEITTEGLGPTQNAVAGGGRYDGLAELLDGPPTKGFGFALGMERMVSLLAEDGAEHIGIPRPDLFLACMNDPSLEEGIRLSGELRRQGIYTFIDLEGRSLKAQMRLANRLESRYTCIIGDEEISRQEFPVKRMEDGHQIRVERQAIASYIKEN